MTQDQFRFAESIQQKFERFHRTNPHVYEELRRMAFDLKAKGHAKIGIGMLFEVLRWNHYINTTDTSGFKLCNNYRSRYARMIMDREPTLRGIFSTKSLTAA